MSEPESDEKSQSAGGSASPTELEQKEATVTPEEPEYPSLGTKILVTFSLSIALLMVALDQTIVATAIPTITNYFNSLGDVGWYASAYFLTLTSLQPTFGKLYKIFNVKRVLLIALALFMLGSLICAVAPTSKALIVGRAISGIGGGGFYSGAFTVLIYIAPLRERPIIMGSVMAVLIISSVVGPVVGGLLAQHVSWRWCFYINLPVGGTAIAMIGFVLPVPKQPLTSLPLRQKLREIDFLGATLFIGAIVSLLLALQWGGTHYPWNSSTIIGLFVGFGLMILLFAFIQYRMGEAATLPVSVVTQRTVLSASLVLLFLNAALFVLIYYLPIYFQAIKGSTPSHSGIQLLPMMLSTVLTTIMTGIAISVLGYYSPFIIIGTCIYAVARGLMTLITVDSPDWRIFGFMIMAGIGAGLGMQPCFIAVQTVLSPETVSIGTSMATFTQTFSGALFTSIAEAIFTNKLVDGITQQIPSLNPTAVLNAGATGLRNLVSPEVLPLLLEIYNEAVRQVFLMIAIIGPIAVVCACFIEWRSVKGKKKVTENEAP